MIYWIRHATVDDLAFARDLTCRNMLRYYIDHDLLWQDEAFDAGWQSRENWIVLQGETPIGFFSLSQDARALYIRELQIAQAWHGRGAGSWCIDQVIEMARQARRPALRLTVFENNPAQELYARKGLHRVGRDECFIRMQLDLSTAVR
ncbi:GNAT family N-acetyltransferase [Pseudomonas sp. Choline-02u-1]|jgi:GNAT superfamily N-acetyltransferase|uniref:GNAT family N-acetyltransferase n=1 Tax=Pseudomonas sp. Choline-02u-1 TaxID=2058307 RepID=UPI000C3326CD|nr:GNAT family N-acetyltransferase [Pseudomonas sp. Choline-02u-1]PKH79383.1 GNAT family N-acetyltransferase [Pseudomonas sp. Choline-02u-1]